MRTDCYLDQSLVTGQSLVTSVCRALLITNRFSHSFVRFWGKTNGAIHLSDFGDFSHSFVRFWDGDFTDESSVMTLRVDYYFYCDKLL